MHYALFIGAGASEETFSEAPGSLVSIESARDSQMKSFLVLKGIL